MSMSHSCIEKTNLSVLFIFFFRVVRFEVNGGSLIKKCQNIYSRSLGPEDPWIVSPSPSSSLSVLMVSSSFKS